MKEKTNNKFAPILLSLFFLVLALEILLRGYYFIFPRRTTLQWYEDEKVGRRLLPNQKDMFVSNTKEYTTLIETNSAGWRDAEHATQKPQDVYRILILGDSFVENFQVPFEKTFFKQAEQALHEKLPDKKIEIIAMGMGDTGTAQQYLALTNYGLEYNPDLIIHFFFSGNDVKNNSKILNGDPYRPYFSLQEGELTPTPFVTKTSIPKYRLLSFLKSKSRLVEFILDTKGKLLAPKPNGIPIDYQVYMENYSSEYREAWDITRALILKTKMEAENHNSDYILVASANNEQVNSNLFDRLLDIYPEMKNANMDKEKPDKILTEFCQTQSLRCYFMFPFFKDFQEKNPSMATHYLRDGHWTTKGTELASQFLQNVLKDYLSIK